MPKRLTIPPELFNESDMALINRATYRTEKKILLRSKRKFLHIDPEAWFLANVVATEHYKTTKTPMPALMSEFSATYKGDDADTRLQYLLDLGKRLYIAFYRPVGVTEEELEKDDSGDWYCKDCDYFNYSFQSHKWCRHYVEKPASRYEWIVWCERCKAWHKKLSVIGEPIYFDPFKSETLCPLSGRVAPVKEIVNIDFDMGGIDEISEGVQSGGEAPQDNGPAGEHPGEVGAGAGVNAGHEEAIREDVRESGGEGSTSTDTEEVEVDI